MQRKTVWIAVAVLLLTALAAAQTQESYLDVYSVQVKPEKRADFDAIAKKMVAANRQSGDTWVATETVYGTGDRVNFISTRQSYADIDNSMGEFYGALEKSLGKAGMEKLFHDFSQCVVSSRGELRRRRGDLSSNAPSDPAALSKMIGESRWLRTVVVHVRPGQVTAFEELAQMVKAARDKAPLTVLVSQAVAGQEGNVYYFTILGNSLGNFDKLPATKELLGEEGYAKYQKASAETVETAETVISRFVPDLSNAPAEVAAAAPDYWTPKPVVAKAKSAKSGVVNAVSTTKEEKPQQ